jgi:hypothetical protein
VSVDRVVVDGALVGLRDRLVEKLSGLMFQYPTAASTAAITPNSAKFLIFLLNMGPYR